MFTPQEEKAHTTAGDEVLPAFRQMLKVWDEGRTPSGETLRSMLGVLEREGIASPIPPFGGAHNNATDDSPITVKVFSDGTIITRTPENWGKLDSRSHGFHARLHPREHEADGAESQHSEGSG